MDSVRQWSCVVAQTPVGPESVALADHRISAASLTSGRNTPSPVNSKLHLALHGERLDRLRARRGQVTIGGLDSDESFDEEPGFLCSNPLDPPLLEFREHLTPLSLDDRRNRAGPPVFRYRTLGGVGKTIENDMLYRLKLYLDLPEHRHIPRWRWYMAYSEQVEEEGKASSDHLSEDVEEEYEGVISIDRSHRYFVQPAVCGHCDRPPGARRHSAANCPVEFQQSRCKVCTLQHNWQECSVHCCKCCRQERHKAAYYYAQLHDHRVHCPLLAKQPPTAEFCVRCKATGHYDSDCQVLLPPKAKFNRPIAFPANSELCPTKCTVCGQNGHRRCRDQRILPLHKEYSRLLSAAKKLLSNGRG